MGRKKDVNLAVVPMRFDPDGPMVEATRIALLLPLEVGQRVMKRSEISGRSFSGELRTLLNYALEHIDDE